MKLLSAVTVISSRSTSIIITSLLLVIIFIGRCSAGQNKEPKPPIDPMPSFEPMVAFVCDYQAMHLTADGWKPDEKTGCIQNPTSILEYCRKLYPSLSINEIVESAIAIRIENWCESRQKQCQKEHSTHAAKPFRCLANSENLPSSHAGSSTPRTSTFLMEPEMVTTRPMPPDDDAYSLFVQNIPELNMTEHEYYVRAKNSLRQRHRIKISKVLEQWARMNQTAVKARNTDEKNNEDMQKQITSRFQKLYDALLQEEKYEDRQLNELHQQRVQGELNRLKRDALENYMNALRGDPVDSSLVLKTLKHYIRMEKRDSDHAVSRFLHIRKKDAHEAETVVSYVIEHLKVIDKRIHQAFEMLDRVPKHKKMIMRLIEPFLRQFDTLEENMAVVSGTKDNDVRTVSNYVSTVYDDAGRGIVLNIHKLDEPMNITEPEDVNQRRVGTVGMNEQKNEELEQGKMNETKGNIEVRDSTTPVVMTTFNENTEDSTPVQSRQQSTVKVVKTSAAAAEVKKKSNLMHLLKSDHAAALMQKNEHHLNEVDLRQKKTSKEPGPFIATPIGMTVFSIAIVLLIAVALLLLHRRVRSSVPATIGSSRPARSRFLMTRKPTVKKIGVSNGYENPTYRYLNSEAKA